jgi:predicted nucleotidyltransferase
MYRDDKSKIVDKSWRERRWRRAGLHALGFKMEEYEKYLETPHWKAFRTLVLEEQLKRVGYNRCERCGKTNPRDDVELHVHHLTYERLGKERIEDTEVICRKCHHEEHGRDPKSRLRYYAPDRKAMEKLAPPSERRSQQVNLKDDCVIALRSWAANNQSVQKLWLFGSRAKGTSRPESDVDLALILMPETDNTNWALAKYVECRHLWKTQLERIVDRSVSLCAIEAGEKLYDEVTTTGMCLWSRP